MKILKTTLYGLTMCAVACSSGGKATETAKQTSQDSQSTETATQYGGIGMADMFSADSAYSHIASQLDFGPRVPGTPAHDACAQWLTQKLHNSCDTVIVQQMALTAFNGTSLPAKNIFGQFNPHATDRTLLVAHWDTRPWADQDPDPAKRSTPVPGANDGASGVGVLLEIARILGEQGTHKGIDILFVDAEDYGSDGDDLSWALGARAFVKTPPVTGYRPDRVILLDMVGGKGSTFPRELFSHVNAPDLLDMMWQCAAEAGESALFVQTPGGAVTDDHVEFLKAGIPAIDIIAFSEQGFHPTWHTTADNLQNIDPDILRAVGRTVLTFLSK